MEGCIFCQIARGEKPAHIIWEDEEYVAFLDRFPNTKGQTLVITREHVSGYVFDMNLDQIAGLMFAAKYVAERLEKGLSVKRMNVVFEGMEIDHIHAKLYPVNGIAAKFVNMVPKESVWFDGYPGYISTLHGPEASDRDLENLARAIRDS